MNQNDFSKYILEKNKQTVSGLINNKSDYFSRYRELQVPQFIWIGCSDSRVVPELLLGLEVGSIFCHRCIGGIIDDQNQYLMSFLYLAVNVLKITNIIISGHTNCAMMGISANGGVDDLPEYGQYIKSKIDTIKNRSQICNNTPNDSKADVLSREVLLEQINNLKKIDFIKNNTNINILGLIVNVGTGLLDSV